MTCRLWCTDQDSDRNWCCLSDILAPVISEHFFFSPKIVIFQISETIFFFPVVMWCLSARWQTLSHKLHCFF